VEKDIFLTGEVSFLNDEEVAKRQYRKNFAERVYSVAIHVAVIALLIWPPKIFRHRQPTAEDQEIARKQMFSCLRGRSKCPAQSHAPSRLRHE
jgi:hypothetical protein